MHLSVCRCFRSLVRSSSSSNITSRLLHGSLGSRESKCRPILIESAEDTHDLMDRLLSVGAVDPAWIFFDIDETLLMRDTCLVHGFQHTTYLLDRLKTRLAETGSSKSADILDRIRSEMEIEYYESDIKLVDPLLARLVRGLKLQGHHVFGLTSNAPTSDHCMSTIAALSKYKIRFSMPAIRGELPHTGALVMEHIVVNGIIFADNRQAALRDKGEIMSEFVDLSLRWHQGYTSTSTYQSAQKQHCILIDNTEKKCKRAVSSFLSGNKRFPLDLKVIHFTQAEAAIDSGLFADQFGNIILGLLREGTIDAEMARKFREEAILIFPNLQNKLK